MITCKKCGIEFPATWRERYPGAAKSGADLVVGAASCFVVAVLLCILGFLSDNKNQKGSAYFLAVLAFALSIGTLLRISEHKKAKERHGGGQCPDYG